MLQNHQVKNVFSMNQRAQNEFGFTLIEISIAITIAIIISAVALPNFDSLLQNNRRTSLNNTFVTLIGNARQVAISRGRTVLLCHSANVNASSPSCGGSGSAWDVGILVYVTSNSPIIKRAYQSANDEIIQREELNAKLDIVANSDGASYIGFSSDGQIFESADTPIFSICDDRGESEGRLISINQAGRLRVSEPLNCSTPS